MYRQHGRRLAWVSGTAIFPITTRKSSKIKPQAKITWSYVSSVPYNVNLPVANAAGALAMTFLNLGNGNQES